jgi:hypothetical protein
VNIPDVRNHRISSVFTGRLTRRLTDIARRTGGALAVSVVLLTGTAIVSPPDFALRAGDELITATAGLGELRSIVAVAGLRRPEQGG